MPNVEPEWAIGCLVSRCSAFVAVNDGGDFFLVRVYVHRYWIAWSWVAGRNGGGSGICFGV